MKTSAYQKIIAAAFVLGLISCTQYIYVSRIPWQSTPVVADGQAAEWTVPLKYYDEKSKLQYSVSNDNTNLYICIKATEEETQKKIYRSGLQIWIDTTANNEHKIGLEFPLSGELRRSDQNMAAHNTADNRTTNSGKKFFNDFIEMNLTGFKAPVNNGVTSVQNTYGISARIDKDSIGIMTYEAVIPFSTFYKNALSSADSLKLMGFSIVLKGLSKEGGSYSGGGHGGGGGGGMRGGGGGGGMQGAGGMRGGGGGHGGGGHSHGSGGGGGAAQQGSDYLYETNTVKKIFQLAVKKT